MLKQAADSSVRASDSSNLPARQPHRVNSERPGFYEPIETASFGWLARNLEYFDPEKVPAGDQRRLAYKALNELSLLLAYRVRLHAGGLDEAGLAILQHIERVVSRPVFQDQLARDHRNFMLYAMIYASLRMCGRENTALRALVEQALRTRHPFIVERNPFRKLDLLHFLYNARISHGLQTFEQVFAESLIAGNPNVLEIDNSDAYAITHVIFYVTDFGFRSSTWADSFDLKGTAALVSELLRRYRLENNADLAAELLATLTCLGVTESTEIRRAWNFLSKHMLPTGRSPGPMNQARMEAATNDEERRQHEWEGSYHTTIVVALAAMMARRAEQGVGYPALQECQPRKPVLSADATQEECQLALSRAQNWLQPLMDGEALTDALRATAGIALSLPILGVSEPLRAALARLAARLDRLEGEANPWEATGLDTLVLVASAFQKAGIQSSLVDDHLSAIVGALTPEAIAHTPAVYATCAALVQLKKLPAHVLEVRTLHMPEGEASPAQPSQVQDSVRTASDLLYRTAHRRERLGLPPERLQALTDQLARDFSVACKSYQLGDAGVILRGLILLEGRDSRLVRDAMAYLLSQQRMDGAFGYFGGDLSRAGTDPIHLSWNLSLMSALVDYAFPESSPFTASR